MDSTAKPKGRPILGRGAIGEEVKSFTTTKKEKKFCPLCKKNGEMTSVFLSHDLKDLNGRVTCPILYTYTCPNCGATGEDAHTESYCPVRPIGPSITGALKNTPRNATGKRNHNK